MTTRKLLAAALAVPLITGVATADAAVKKPAPKPTCKLVQDKTGDATGVTGPAADGPNDPNLDIVWADIASNAKQLTAVLQLAAIGASPDTSPAGKTYDIGFLINKTGGVRLRIVLAPADTASTPNLWPYGGKGTVDTARKQLRVTVDLAKLPTVIKPGAVLSNFSVLVQRTVYNTDAVISVTDKADSTATYKSGYPSCVKVGA